MYEKLKFNFNIIIALEFNNDPTNTFLSFALKYQIKLYASRILSIRISALLILAGLRARNI